MYVFIYMYVYIHIYIYIIFVFIYLCIYIYICFLFFALRTEGARQDTLHSACVLAYGYVRSTPWEA